MDNEPRKTAGRSWRVCWRFVARTGFLGSTGSNEAIHGRTSFPGFVATTNDVPPTV